MNNNNQNTKTSANLLPPFPPEIENDFYISEVVVWLHNRAKPTKTYYIVKDSVTHETVKTCMSIASAADYLHTLQSS